MYALHYYHPQIRDLHATNSDTRLFHATELYFKFKNLKLQEQNSTLESFIDFIFVCLRCGLFLKYLQRKKKRVNGTAQHTFVTRLGMFDHGNSIFNKLYCDKTAVSDRR